MLHPSDASDLEFYLCEADTYFRKSVQGQAWEAALNRSYDSQGKRIPAADPNGDYARPTSPRGTPVLAYSVPEDFFIRFGQVQRRLALISPESQLVLSAYHGNFGNRWSLSHRGRYVSLFPLVSAGQKLISLGIGKSDRTPRDVLETEITLDAVQKTVPRRPLIEAALKQAQDLYLHACQEWNTKTPHSDPDSRNLRMVSNPNTPLVAQNRGYRR